MPSFNRLLEYLATCMLKRKWRDQEDSFTTFMKVAAYNYTGERYILDTTELEQYEESKVAVEDVVKVGDEIEVENQFIKLVRLSVAFMADSHKMIFIEVQKVVLIVSILYPIDLASSTWVLTVQAAE